MEWACGRLVGRDAHGEGAAGLGVHGDGADAGVGEGGHGRGESDGVDLVVRIEDRHGGEGDVQERRVRGGGERDTIVVLEIDGQGVLVRAVHMGYDASFRSVIGRHFEDWKEDELAR